MRSKEERSICVARLRERFAQEGGIPDAEKEALLDGFVEGTVTLANLFDHARDYVTTAAERHELARTIVREAPAFKRMYEEYEASIPAYHEEQRQKNIVRMDMDKEQRERHEAIDAARANVELSGGEVGEDHLQHALRWANGEITMHDYLTPIKI